MTAMTATTAETTTPGKGASGPRLSRFRRFRQRLSVLGAFIRENYCVMEPRTAGLFRWVLGFLCATDLIRHWKEARWFYANTGVLTNHYHLWRPSSNFNFSAFHAFSTLGEVHVAFTLALFCHLCLMIGWRTRLFAVLTFIIVTSLDNRLVMVENGGYVVVNLIAAYAMFLPIGERFSLDALLRSYRERKEKTLAELDAPYHPAWASRPYVSIAVLLVILNLAVVYFFNVINKSGQLWRHGETVHYVLYLNRMVTGIAVFFRDLLPFWMTRGITWSVLCLEALLVPWILSPSGRRITRTLAVLGIWMLHSTFGVMMRLGPFAWFLIGWSFLLWTPAQWEMLERWYRKRASARVVVLDRGSPLAFALGRFLRRLDNLDLLRFEASPEGVASPDLLAVRAEGDGPTFTGMAALRESAQALPGGRYAFPIVRIATLGLLGPAFSFASARRKAIARFFGLTLPPRGEAEEREPSPVSQKLARGRAFAREAFLLYLGCCFLLQAFVENKAIPPQLKPKLPAVMAATLVYPRLFQGWGMFAPNPITDDGSITVDARTIDGRRVDPFTRKEPDLDLTDSRGLGLEQIWQDYFNRIRLDRNQVFRQGLKDYLLRWHLETGRPEDELVAFDVYWVRDQCPKPDEKRPTKNETIAILTYRKPGFRPPPEQSPLAPEPKVQSAEVTDAGKQEAGKQEAKPKWPWENIVWW